jgi:malate dehydrogenase (oxaloacetate-decarboxylating)
MKQAAASSLAACIAPAELSPEYIVPSVFNREVVRRVATAVRAAAIKAGVARKAS